MISKREKSCIVITLIIFSISTIVALNAVDWDTGRFVSGERISIVGYSFLMTVGLFFGHLNELIIGNTPNELFRLDQIGIFFGLAILTFVAVPLMIKLTNEINIFRRVSYVWVSVTQLSFMAILYIGVLK